MQGQLPLRGSMASSDNLKVNLNDTIFEWKSIDDLRTYIYMVQLTRKNEPILLTTAKWLMLVYRSYSVVH